MQRKKRKTEADSRFDNEGIFCFALNCSNDGFVLLDEDESVLFINKKFEEWTNIWNSTWNERPFPSDSLFLENSEKELFKKLLQSSKEGNDGELTFGFKYQDQSEQRMTVNAKRHDKQICCKFQLLEHFTFTDKQKLDFYETADPYLPEFSVGRYEPDKDDVLSMFSSLRAKNKKKQMGCTQFYNRYYIADLKFKNSVAWVSAISKVGPKNPVATFESLVSYPGGPDTYLFLICHFVREDEYGRKIVVTISDPTARNQAHLTKHNVEMVSEIASSMRQMFDPEVIPATLEVVDDGTDILFHVQSNARIMDLDSSESKRLSQLGWTREDIEMWLTKCSECSLGKSVMFEFRPQHTPSEAFRCLLLHIAANSFAIVMLNLAGRKELENKLTRHKEDLENQVYRYTKELDEALQVKSRFLAVMSHEMRTPLSGILATLSLLNETQLDGDQKELVRVGEVCGQQLLLVINDILDYGKLDANKVVLDNIPFALKNVLEESVEVVSFEARSKGLELISCIDPSVPKMIDGDPGRLRQVLVNLLGNAVKFSIHGEVVLSARAVSSGKFESERMDSIEISVKDEGIGIEEAQKHKLFQAFSQVDSSVTRRHAGTGLGLSISKRLTELMGGKMWFQSKVGVGSTFYLQIPLGKDSYIAQPLSIHLGLPSTPVSIVIVEKSQTLLHHLNHILEHRGFKCYCTSSLEEAQRYTSKNTLKLVLVDARFDMTLVRSLVNIHQGPVYLLGNSPFNKQQGSDTTHPGPLPFIRKPITERSLFEVVLREHNMPGEDDKTVTTQTSYGGTSIISLADIVNTHRILLAEDNLLNQQIIVKMLHSIGFKKENIALVATGRQAVDFVRNCFQTNQRLDVILMDVMMPEMGGIEATEIIRREFGQVPAVIALTANAFTEDKVKCLQCGMNSVLTKPVNKQDLADTLLKYSTLKKDTNNK